MFDDQGDSSYDEILKDLLSRLFSKNDRTFAAGLGASVGDGFLKVPFFGSECTVRPDGVYLGEAPLHTIASVIVVRYLLEAGEDPIFNIWVPFRDLKDGAQMGNYVQSKIEGQIARDFAGKKEQLEKRLTALGGNVYRTGKNPDLAVALIAFPRIHLLMLFWDGDKDSVGMVQFLFDKSARAYLDIESLVGLLEYIRFSIKE